MNSLKSLIQEVKAYRDPRACSDAREWLHDLAAEGVIDAEVAWQRCRRGDWMLWLLWRRGVPPRQLAPVACAIVRETPLADGRVWDLLTDPRSRAAISITEHWLRGETSDKELHAAIIAAAAAYDDAAAAAYAASAAAYDAAAAAAYAASAAAYAASAAAYDAAHAAAYAASAAAYDATSAAAYDAAHAAAYDAAHAAAYASACDVQATIVRRFFPTLAATQSCSQAVRETGLSTERS